MTSRRSLLLSAASALAFAPPFRPQAFEIQPYDAAAAQKAIASGKPVIVHVYAPWCLQCHAQASILDNLKADKAYDGVKFFRVDYDGQKDIVAKLDCPRSTVIAYKGGKEVARMSWGMTQDFGRRTCSRRRSEPMLDASARLSRRRPDDPQPLRAAAGADRGRGRARERSAGAARARGGPRADLRRRRRRARRRSASNSAPPIGCAGFRRF